MLSFSVGAEVEPPSALCASPIAWSVTRHRLLNGPERCDRAYYWRYVGSRGGHDPRTARPVVRDAWVLRHLVSLSLLLGTVLHTALREMVLAVVDRTRRPTTAELLEGARFTLNHAWFASRRELRERFWRIPLVSPALREVLYGPPPDPAEMRATKALLARALEHLTTAPVLRDLAAAQRKEVFVGDRFGAAYSLMVDGAPVAVWVSPALIYGHRTPGTPQALGRWRGAPAWCVTEFVAADAVAGRMLYFGGEATAPETCALAGPRASDGARSASAEGVALGRLRFANAARWLAARGVPTARGGYLGRLIDLATGAAEWQTLTDALEVPFEEVVTRDVARQRAFFVDGDPDRPHVDPEDATSLAPAPNPAACAACAFLALCPDRWPGSADPLAWRHALAAPPSPPVSAVTAPAPAAATGFVARSAGRSTLPGPTR